MNHRKFAASPRPLARALLVAGVLAGGLFASAPAAAQGKSNVITLNEITIVGRVQKPIAAAIIARLRGEIELTEMRQPFVERIEIVIRDAPF